MKLYLLSLVLMVGMGCAAKPVPITNPQVQRLKAYAESHQLHWAISTSDQFYCAALWHDYTDVQANCRLVLAHAVSDVIAVYPPKKPWKISDQP